MRHPNQIYMKKAIEEAKKSVKQGQYALGAVVVVGNEIISVAHTTLHKTNDPTAHAEMNAIRLASKKIGSRYLSGGWLYTTQEPCPMCTSAAIWAKMEGIVYGANMVDALKVFQNQKREKFTWRQINISAANIVAKGEPKLKLYKNFLREECIELFKISK